MHDLGTWSKKSVAAENVVINPSRSEKQHAVLKVLLYKYSDLVSDFPGSQEGEIMSGIGMGCQKVTYISVRQMFQSTNGPPAAGILE